MEEPAPVYRVIFDENGGETPARPPERLLLTAPHRLDTLPEAPSWTGRAFLGWNTARDGSGEAVGETTLLPGSLRLYAQWRSEQLNVYLSSSLLTFSPMEDYSQATLRVAVSGFDSALHAQGVELEVEGEPAWQKWLAWHTERAGFAGDTLTFHLSVRYVGQGFDEGVVALGLHLLHMPAQYSQLIYAGGPELRVAVGSGEPGGHPIPLSQANIEAFNAYANSAEGQARLYRLMEDVALPTPPPQASNWTPIADFRGSLDGGGHRIEGLRIEAPEEDLQGLFGLIGAGAVVKNLGLTGARVTGQDAVGTLVGENMHGGIHHCYATGAVRGRFSVGGLVGSNRGNSSSTTRGGTLGNSYAAVDASGTGYVGGLVGRNTNVASIYNSYAIGNVRAQADGGGLVGLQLFDATVRNSYATGAVYGSNYMGGLIGDNNQFGYAYDSVALGPRVLASSNISSTRLGRVSGQHSGNAGLENNYARSHMDMRRGVDADGEGGVPTPPSPDADGVDGQSVSAAEYNSLPFWQGLGWDFENIWQWGPNNLPILKGLGGEQNHAVP